MLKKRIKKILVISMALSMLFTTNTFATPINLVNSTEDVQTDILDKTQGTDYFKDETTNEWLNGQIFEEVRVTVDLESLFDVTIPKEIIFSGETKNADYEVTVKGDIAGDQMITVVPDAEFNMSETGGKEPVIATVTQDDAEFTYDQIIEPGKTVNGLIEALGLTAGEWSGKFNFNINFEGEGSVSIPETGQPLEAYSWDEIAAISEAGLAQDYFNIGDEKKITLDSTSTVGVNTLADTGETYTLRIIGFNHDDLTDGSGKAGITFSFTNLMTEKYAMTETASNKGGWEVTKMRNYLNTEIIERFPNVLKQHIKAVNKISDMGNKNSIDTNITSDKIFLLSWDEIGFVEGQSSTCVKGLGTSYEYFIDNVSSKRVMSFLNGTKGTWYIRNTRTANTNVFVYISTSGVGSSTGTYSSCDTPNGVLPVFCI